MTELLERTFAGDESDLEDAFLAEMRGYIKSEGGLSRSRARYLAEFRRCSERTIYRMAERLRDAKPDLDDDEDDTSGWTFLDYLERYGSRGFCFDDLALTLLYTVSGNMSRLREEVIAAGFAMPSLPTLSRLAQELPRHVRDGARFGQAHRHANVLHIRHSAEHPNESWETDECFLRISVRSPRDGYKRIQPHMLLFIDDYSRFITSAAFLAHDVNTAHFLCALAAGIEIRPADDGSGRLIGGAPDQIVFDNAQAFRSYVSAETLLALPITARPSPAYGPTAKGKVERVNATIENLIVTGVPGVNSNSLKRNGKDDLLGIADAHLLDWDTFVMRALQAVHHYNYNQVHSVTGTTPIERYTPKAPRQVADADLAALWLPGEHAGGRRKVTHDGLHFENRIWVDACLAPHLVATKRDVEVRVLHHRREHIAVFFEGHFVGLVKEASELTKTEREDIMHLRKAEWNAVDAHAHGARDALRQRAKDIDRDADSGALGALIGTQGEVSSAAAKARATLAKADSETGRQNRGEMAKTNVPGHGAAGRSGTAGETTAGQQNGSRVKKESPQPGRRPKTRSSPKPTPNAVSSAKPIPRKRRMVDLIEGKPAQAAGGDAA